MPFRDYILNHLGWKLLSVISAVLIWWAIHSNIDESFKLSDSRTFATRTASHTIEVTVMMKATDMRRFAVTPKEVEVTVRGEPGVLNNLKLSEVLALVNLIDVKDETNFRKRVNVRTPTNVIPIRVVPEEVTVESIAGPDTANARRNQE